MLSMRKDRVRPPGNPRSDRHPKFSGAEGVKWDTGHQDAGNQASYGKNATGRSKNVNLRNGLRIGTWNVRGLLEDGKLHILEQELERCELTIAGISETHWKDSGHFDSEKHTIYFSGNDKSSFSGVAIAIPKLWKNSVLGYHPINDRIISIKLSASPTPLNIIQVYAPTSSARDEEVEDFYCQLKSSISHASKVMLHIINTRLLAYLSRQIAPEQAGFVKGRGTREQILILRQIIEKAREFNTTLYICFVDFRKAFDTVIWTHLWKILAEMGVPPHLIVLLRRLYEDGTAAVRVDDTLSSGILNNGQNWTVFWQCKFRSGCVDLEISFHKINYIDAFVAAPRPSPSSLVLRTDVSDEMQEPQSSSNEHMPEPDQKQPSANYNQSNPAHSTIQPDTEKNQTTQEQLSISQIGDVEKRRHSMTKGEQDTADSDTEIIKSSKIKRVASTEDVNDGAGSYRDLPEHDELPVSEFQKSAATLPQISLSTDESEGVSDLGQLDRSHKRRDWLHSLRGLGRTLSRADRKKTVDVQMKGSAGEQKERNADQNEPSSHQTTCCDSRKEDNVQQTNSDDVHDMNSSGRSNAPQNENSGEETESGQYQLYVLGYLCPNGHFRCDFGCENLPRGQLGQASFGESSGGKVRWGACGNRHPPPIPQLARVSSRESSGDLARCGGCGLRHPPPTPQSECGACGCGHPPPTLRLGFGGGRSVGSEPAANTIETEQQRWERERHLVYAMFGVRPLQASEQTDTQARGLTGAVAEEATTRIYSNDTPSNQPVNFNINNLSADAMSDQHAIDADFNNDQSTSGNQPPIAHANVNINNQPTGGNWSNQPSRAEMANVSKQPEAEGNGGEQILNRLRQIASTSQGKDLTSIIMMFQINLGEINEFYKLADKIVNSIKQFNKSEANQSISTQEDLVCSKEKETTAPVGRSDSEQARLAQSTSSPTGFNVSNHSQAGSAEIDSERNNPEIYRTVSAQTASSSKSQTSRATQVCGIESGDKSTQTERPPPGSMSVWVENVAVHRLDRLARAAPAWLGPALPTLDAVFRAAAASTPNEPRSDLSEKMPILLLTQKSNGSPLYFHGLFNENKSLAYGPVAGMVQIGSAARTVTSTTSSAAPANNAATSQPSRVSVNSEQSMVPIQHNRNFQPMMNSNTIPNMMDQASGMPFFMSPNNLIRLNPHLTIGPPSLPNMMYPQHNAVMNHKEYFQHMTNSNATDNSAGNINVNTFQPPAMNNTLNNYPVTAMNANSTANMGQQSQMKISNAGFNCYNAMRQNIIDNDSGLRNPNQPGLVPTVQSSSVPIIPTEANIIQRSIPQPIPVPRKMTGTNSMTQTRPNVRHNRPNMVIVNQNRPNMYNLYQNIRNLRSAPKRTVRVGSTTITQVPDSTQELPTHSDGHIPTTTHST